MLNFKGLREYCFCITTFSEGNSLPLTLQRKTRFFLLLLLLLLQEHQDSILGNTMQTVIALLNNVVANKSTNMMLLFEEGMSYLSLVILLTIDVSQSVVISGIV